MFVHNSFSDKKLHSSSIKEFPTFNNAITIFSFEIENMPFLQAKINQIDFQPHLHQTCGRE